MLVRRPSLALLLAGACSATVSAQDSFAVLGGTQFTAGRYGSDRTVSTVSLAVGALATTGRWRWWATVPFIFQDAATVRTIGAGMLPVGGTAHSSMNGSSSGMMGSPGMAGINTGGSSMTGHAGAGDPLLRVDATVVGSAASTQSLALHAAVKAPLANASSGFGTGRWDEAVGATFARRASAYAILADVSYWHVGRLRDDPFRDVATGTFTIARPLGRAGQQVYGSLIAATPFVTGTPGPVQLAGAWSHRGADRHTFAVTAGTGVTSTAPAFSLSASWQWGLR